MAIKPISHNGNYLKCFTVHFTVIIPGRGGGGVGADKGMHPYTLHSLWSRTETNLTEIVHRNFKKNFFQQIYQPSVVIQISKIFNNNREMSTFFINCEMFTDYPCLDNLICDMSQYNRGCLTFLTCIPIVLANTHTHPNNFLNYMSQSLDALALYCTKHYTVSKIHKTLQPFRSC